MNYASRADIESLFGNVVEASQRQIEAVLASPAVQSAFDPQPIYAAPVIPDGMREDFIRDALARVWSRLR